MDTIILDNSEIETVIIRISEFPESSRKWADITDKPAVIAAGDTIEEALEQIGLENVNSEINSLQEVTTILNEDVTDIKEEQITQNEAIDLKADKVNLPPTPSNVLDVNSILRRGNVISNIIDQYTGEPITATKVTGTPTVDNIIYFQIGSEYFKRNLSSDVINIRWFGAKGDWNGTTGTNNTLFIQKVLDIANYVPINILVPKGVYLIDTEAGLSIYSNTNLIGEGIGSILYARKDIGFGLLSVNYGEGGTPDISDNQKNIQIRNIHFKYNENVTFREQAHLLNLNAVSDININGCFFTGWKGDAIHLGSSNVGGVERHNENVTITNNFFDGVNKDNRNAVSVIDCNKLLIDNNIFINCTRSNMPGAIDIEPDINDFTIIYDLLITNNRFDNTGGNIAVIGIVCNDEPNTLNQKIYIANNSISNSNNPFFVKLNIPTADTPENGVIIEYNIVSDCQSCFNISDSKGVRLRYNKFQNTSGINYIGYVEGVTVLGKARDLYITDNEFDNCAFDISNTQFTAIFHIHGLFLYNNIFKNCTSGANGKYLFVLQSNGSQENIKIKDNKFFRTDANNILVQYFTYGGASTSIENLNEVSGNKLGGLAQIGTIPYRRIRGTTLLRPTLTTTDVGYGYFDTDLTKEIWWTGTVWLIPANSTGENGYIRNQTTSQTANYNISGDAKNGGNNVVGGKLSVGIDELPTAQLQAVIPAATAASSSVAFSAKRALKTASSGVVMDFELHNSSDTFSRYAQFLARIIANNIGAENGAFIIRTMKNGTLTDAIFIDQLQRIGIGGLLTPLAKLHIPASDGTANTTPMKLTSGVLTAIPEVGAFEFVGDVLYFTITTDVSRKRIAFMNDLAIIDATSTPYTKSTINTAYPNAKRGFRVIQDSGGFTYTKKDDNSTGEWSKTASSQLA